MVSVYRKIMTMQIKNGLCLLWVFALMLAFAACSHRQKGDESWHKDIDEFMSSHQSLMQSHPDSMIMLIRNFKCEGRYILYYRSGTAYYCGDAKPLSGTFMCLGWSAHAPQLVEGVHV